MKYVYLGFALIAAVFTTSARAEVVNCTEITAVPVVITVQGIYCLKGNLSSALTSGSLIDIQTNNVTIDFNGFKLGGLAAGASTIATGIFAQNRKNITIRNGAVRGFFRGIVLDQIGAGVSSGHLIEDMLLDGNKELGIQTRGGGMTVRRNRIINTGSSGLITFANGIVVSTARNSVIADNLISGTSESAVARGIFVTNSTLIEVRGNSVLDIKDAIITRGIEFNSSSDITLIGNRVINGASIGSTGITGSVLVTNIKCIENIVAGYAIALTGCNFLSGNILVP